MKYEPLTSGVVLLGLGARCSTACFGSTILGALRDFGRGEGVPESDLMDPPRPTLPALVVAGIVLLFEVSDKPDLFKMQIEET